MRPEREGINAGEERSGGPFPTETWGSDCSQRGGAHVTPGQAGAGARAQRPAPPRNS